LRTTQVIQYAALKESDLIFDPAMHFSWT